MKWYEKVFILTLLVIFGGIVVHAPLSVGLGSLWPNWAQGIKAWKELLMVAAGVLALYILMRKRQTGILREPLMAVIGLYVVLHIFLLAYLPQSTLAAVSGLMIDLRYVAFFVLVYITIRLYPQYKSLFIKIGVIGALVALIFAMLQVFILPTDILKYIGYNIHTISPYLTIDQNHNFIRINSTFRGPNPLGAYAGIVLAILLAYVIKHRPSKKWPAITIAILILGALTALVASYSRSAYIAAVVEIVIVLIVAGAHRISRKVWIVTCVIIFAVIGGLIAMGGSMYLSNVFLHENPDGGSSINSNEGHVASLASGVYNLATQPLGAGIGSTGSASIIGNHSLIVENQYLFTAHETGWIGLVLFVGIFVAILVGLWRKRQDYLALSVFASGIGLAIIGLLLPIWVDDTVSIIWWGLAAIVLAMGSKHARK